MDIHASLQHHTTANYFTADAPTISTFQYTSFPKVVLKATHSPHKSSINPPSKFQFSNLCNFNKFSFLQDQEYMYSNHQCLDIVHIAKICSYFYSRVSFRQNVMYAQLQIESSLYPHLPRLPTKLSTYP